MPYETRPLPTQKRLKELFDYDPLTGEWRRKSNGRISQPCASHKYVLCNVDGVKYIVSRLIWVWVKGSLEAEEFIDHDNLNKVDNRWKNLKKLSWGDNQRNTHAKNKTGLPKHVYPARNGKFTAVIRIGTYRTVGEAENAVRHVVTLLHQEGVHPGASRL